MVVVVGKCNNISFKKDDEEENNVKYKKNKNVVSHSKIL
jgi:hypothetical protein